MIIHNLSDWRIVIETQEQTGLDGTKAVTETYKLRPGENVTISKHVHTLIVR